MIEDKDINSLNNGISFSLPTQPLAHFINANDEFVYYVNYHGAEAQAYHDYFCQFAKLL